MAPICTTMPRVVVDVSQEILDWLESQRGDWKPRTAVLREIIEDAMVVSGSQLTKSEQSK
jgi:hypothetical protein